MFTIPMMNLNTLLVFNDSFVVANSRNYIEHDYFYIWVLGQYEVNESLSEVVSVDSF